MITAIVVIILVLALADDFVQLCIVVNDALRHPDQKRD